MRQAITRLVAVGPSTNERGAVWAVSPAPNTGCVHILIGRDKSTVIVKENCGYIIPRVRDLASRIVACVKTQRVSRNTASFGAPRSRLVSQPPQRRKLNVG